MQLYSCIGMSSALGSYCVAVKELSSLESHFSPSPSGCSAPHSGLLLFFYKVGKLCKLLTVMFLHVRLVNDFKLPQFDMFFQNFGLKELRGSLELCLNLHLCVFESLQILLRCPHIEFLSADSRELLKLLGC